MSVWITHRIKEIFKMRVHLFNTSMFGVMYYSRRKRDDLSKDTETWAWKIIFSKTKYFVYLQAKCQTSNIFLADFTPLPVLKILKVLKFLYLKGFWMTVSDITTKNSLARFCFFCYFWCFRVRVLFDKLFGVLFCLWNQSIVLIEAQTAHFI